MSINNIKSIKILFIILITYFSLFSISLGTIYYVDYENGNDSNNGLTTLSAFWITFGSFSSSYNSLGPNPRIGPLSISPPAPV